MKRVTFRFGTACAAWVASLLFFFGFGADALAQARLDLLEVPGRLLRNNPLHDPATRKAAVFLEPGQLTNSQLRAVYFLPGFGGSSDKVAQKPEAWLAFVSSMCQAGKPVVLIVVDGRNRFGGSQYVNSSAQGAYADYVCKEVVPMVERHYGLKITQDKRVIAGHSSGGFGALRLGMMAHQLFGSVVALSPDSDFEASHLPLVLLPEVAAITPDQANDFLSPVPTAPLPTNGDVRYALALSAAYAPAPGGHRGVEWLYDQNGKFRKEVWKRWVANDPLAIIEKDRRAFRLDQRVYLDGPAEDEYQANIGARKMFEVLHRRGVSCLFEEPPGKHSSRTLERLRRGLEWSAFGRP